MSIRSALADYLESEGISVVYSFHDSAPDEAVGLFPYSGEPGIYVKGRRAPAVSYARVQVVCRAPDEDAAEQLAERTYRLLDGAHRELGVSSVRALQSPFRAPGGSDEEERIAWIFNIMVIT